MRWKAMIKYLGIFYEKAILYFCYVKHDDIKFGMFSKRCRH
jgi:hypothetical protein